MEKNKDIIVKNFIVFEGIDGSGTTTQIKRLAKNFPDDKIATTAEPTSSETGLFLRKMLKGDFKVCEKTAAYLFAADRCEHVYGKNGILELAKSGKTVLCDRYFFSSLAYQSVSCGKELPELLNSPFPLPEILFYFVIAPEISLERVAARGGEKEIYERLDFQKQTAEWYEKIIGEYESTPKGDGMKIVRIDASKGMDEIAAEIYHTLCKSKVLGRL